MHVAANSSNQEHAVACNMLQYIEHMHMVYALIMQTRAITEKRTLQVAVMRHLQTW